MVREFYDRQGITDKKVVVFSDSLDIEHCLEYKTIAEEAGLTPTFGVGTFFTSESDIYVLDPSMLIPSKTITQTKQQAINPSH